MKTLPLSIVLLCGVFLFYTMSIPIVNAAVPMAEITIMGGANTQNCNSCLNPQNITVSRGTAIEWINKDLVFHDMASGRPGDADNGTLFDSGVILVGKSSIQDFDNVGVFPYFDKKYPWNTGTITVIDSTMPTKHIGYPSPKLASADNQTIVATALSIPELQNWSHDWKFVGMAFLGNNKAGTPDFKWQYAIINLKAPSDSTPIPCDNDWWAWIEIDMTTMKVVQATYPTMESHQCQVAMGGGPGLIIAKNTQPPLQQFKSGISAKDIKCASGLQIVIKTTNRSPACVKPEDVSKLVERGWADKPNSLQEQLDFANTCIGMTEACRNSSNAKNTSTFGITALIVYHPPDLCLNSPSHSVPSSMPSCPPNKFYLKINSNSTAYLMGYNICDGNSCATNNTLSLVLPLNTGLNPDYQMIGLPVNLPWKYGDTVDIQIKASHTADNRTASSLDLGNSKIVS